MLDIHKANSREALVNKIFITRKAIIRVIKIFRIVDQYLEKLRFKSLHFVYSHRHIMENLIILEMLDESSSYYTYLSILL